MNTNQQIFPEIWKSIPHHTRYEISTFGRVRHIRHTKILKPSKPHNGYLQVNIYNDLLGRSFTKCIHQLMALTFLGKKPKGFEVAHKDKKKENNHILNLCYLFWRENRRVAKPRKNICVFCGGKRPNHNRKYCSGKCRFLDTHTLVTCETCNKQFLRRNSTIRAASPERRYTFGRIYCTRYCANQGKYKR